MKEEKAFSPSIERAEWMLAAALLAVAALGAWMFYGR
jgi:hypothetical protein